MRFSKPQTDGQLTYQSLKIRGCSNLNIGFGLLASEPMVSKRRYCNKTLVHECVQSEIPEPLDLSKVEFLATSDPCYEIFEIVKTSDGVDPSIQLELNSDSLVTNVVVSFTAAETTCMPLALAYRLYGYIDSDRILLAQGILYIAPCKGSCVEKELWAEIDW